MNTSTRIICTAVTLLFAAFAFFFGLGHYALWDDEASTAIHAKGILATGDTSAIVGHNVYAYRGGSVLKNLCDRVTPPFSSYLAAGMIALAGDSPASVRFPFALCGFFTVALMLWWLHKDNASKTMWMLTCLAIVCNVSLYLFSRNCRYYGPVIFTSTALAYLYCHWRGTPWQRLLWVLASLVLLTSNYMSVLIVYGCLAVDYFAFGRKQTRFSARDFCWILIPQFILGAAVVSVWNPLATDHGRAAMAFSLRERLTLLWWNLRDTNTCEFYVGGLILLALAVCWKMKDEWLRRALLAFAVFIVGTTLVSPQSVLYTQVADVRYCLPLIPLGIFIGARTLALLGARFPGQIVMLGAAVFFTNVLNGGVLLSTGFHAGIALYVQELFLRPEDPFTVTAAWINSNVKEGESIYVAPDYMIAPLIYRAPKAVYAWQLGLPVKPQFKDLAPINFFSQGEPDYLIGFGPAVLPFVKNAINRRQEIKSRYIQVKILTCYSRDLFRPELFWRNFGKDPSDDGCWGVSIYKRVPLVPEDVKGSLIVPKSF